MAESITILHVEDEPGLAEVAGEFLEREDERFDVHHAPNADEGEEMLDDLEIDCIVSDYDMPGRNGLEFLKSVREGDPDLPFILYTGKGSEEVASEAITAGVTDYLQKESGTDQYTILANRINNAVELHHVEEEAERTLTQLRAISANSADGIVIIDSDSRIHFANRTVSDYFGYTPSELEGERLTTIMPERHRERHLAALDRYMETGERTVSWSNVEFSGLHKDGSEVPLSVSYGEFQQDGDRRFVGIMRDVSEHRQMQEALQEREERFRQLAESVQEVIWMSDPAFEELIYVNPAFERIWGRERESFYDEPESLLNTIHPQDRKQVEQTLEDPSTGEFDETFRIERPDGDHRWIRARGIPVEDEAGDVYRIVGVAADVTDQKQREQELREKQAELRKYELAVENSIDLLAACDTDYVLLFANEQYQDYHGIESPDVARESLPEVLGDEWERTVKVHVDRALAGDVVRYEMERSRSNGDVRTLDIRYYPLREDDGSIIGTVAAMRDMTSVWEEKREREKTIERVTDAIVEVDAAWRFTLVNEQAEDLYGMSEEYLLGREFWEVFNEAQGTRFEEEYRAVMETREPTSFVEYFSRLDGWFDIKAYPKDDGGLSFYFIDVTDERERQHELQRTKERLDLALSVTRTGIWEWDLETDEVTWDETLERAVGLEPGAFEGTLEAFRERVHPDDRPAVEKEIEHAVENDELYETQFRMSHEDGGVIRAAVRGRVVGGDGGGHRMVGVHHDVTEREERERQLRRQQAFIESSLDALQDIFFVVNEDGELIRGNARVPEISGHSDEEIREMEPTDFFVEEHRERIQDSFREVFETGSSTVQADIVTKAGERIPFEFVGTRLQNPMGDGMVACGIGRDISERVERERELREQTRRLQGVLDSVEAAIWIRDLDSRFALANRNFRDLFDIDESVEIEGHGPSDVLPEDVAEQFRENDQRVLEREERIEFEEAVETAAGKRTFLTRIAPLYDDGELFATCGVATDVTDLKRTQAELERINEQLDGVASIVSHDLRNPLTVAAGRLELAREEHDSEHLEAVGRAHDRMEALIDDILTLAREGNRVGEKETVALDDLVKDSWGVVETRDATLDIQTGRDVRADASQLQQLLENLLRNAIDHGGSSVTVTVGDLDGGFFVEDTGPGIPPAARDEVFEAGYTTSSEGTGFGLNIVEQIADAHGWALQVTEAAGGGARFEVRDVDGSA